MNAKNEDKFTSKEFKICGATWTLNCYPNGHETDDKGFCSLFLHCCSLPIYSQSIEVNYHISFVEIAEIKHLAKSFDKGVSWGYSQAFRHKQLKTLKSKKLTIKCIIQRTMNIDNIITDNELYWNIDGKLLQRFKSAVNEESYDSPTFKTNDGSIFFFSCYPNGIDEIDEGYFSLYLHNKSLSNLRKNGIGINYQIQIIELNKIFNYAKTFKNNDTDDSWGNSQVFEQKRLYKLSRLTIKCVIQETMRIHQENNNEIIWKVEENLLQCLKSAKCDDEFASPMFTICDTEWNISCYPNGFDDNKGYFSLYLECNGFMTEFMDHININYRFECMEMKNDELMVGGSTRMFQIDDSYGKHRLFLNKELQKMNKLTIKCTIQSTKKVWKLEDEILRGMKYNDYGNNSYFIMSEDIKMCDAKWCVEIHKNYRNRISFNLRCKTLPDGMHKMGVNYRICYGEDMENMVNEFNSQKWFTINDSVTWSQCCNLDKIVTFDQLYIECSVQETMLLGDIDDEKKNDNVRIDEDEIIWNIKGFLLEMLQNESAEGAMFESPYFELCEAIWSIKYADNRLSLICHDIVSSSDLSSINYEIECREIDYKIGGRNKPINIGKECRFLTRFKYDKLESNMDGLCIRCKINKGMVIVVHLETDEEEEITKYCLEPVINEDNMNDNMNNKRKQELNQYERILEKHDKLIKKWNNNSNKLNQIVTLIDSQHLIAMDEKQEDDHSGSVGKTLYEKYVECYSIIEEQTERLNQVTLDTHIPELIKSQNLLNKELNEYERMASEKKENEEEYNDYQAVKQKRIMLQNKIEDDIKECNELIEKENRLFYEQYEKRKLGSRSDEDFKKLEISSNKCLELIKAYNDFMVNNNEYIDKLRKYFDEKWPQFESKWIEWNTDDVIGWIKYVTKGMDLKSINWKKIEEEMKLQNMNGVSLKNINDNDLHIIGVNDFCVRNHLMDKILGLRNKYKMIDNDDDKKEEEIPSRFICPITKKIMIDPVMAFDGYIYDRNAIQMYLKNNNKSPITNTKPTVLYLFENKPLKKEIDLFIQLNRHKNIEEDGDDTQDID